MTKKYDILVLDASNLYHRSYNSCITRGFTNKKLYQKTIEQFLMSLKKLEKDYLWEWGRTFILFDNPTSQVSLRSEISSDYKAQRKKMPKLFYDYLNYLKTLLLSYSNNYQIAYADLLEGDDLVQPILDILDLKESIILVSADLDWSRSIYYQKRDIVWYNFDQVYDQLGFELKYEFPPTVDKIILYKCLTGDTSDGIAKVIKQLSNRNIKQLCNEFNSVEEVFININSIDYLSQIFKYRIQENIEQLRINKKLIEFINITQFGHIENYIHDCTYKPNELKLFYTGLKIDDGFDERLKERFENKSKKPKKGLFQLDRLPRK